VRSWSHERASAEREGHEFDQNIILSFCHHVRFFSDQEAGERWIAGRENAFLLSLEQGLLFAAENLRAGADGPSPWAPQTPSFLKSLTIVRRRDHRRVTSPGTARQRRRHPIAAVRGKATAAAPAARAATAAAADGQPFRQSFL